MLTLSIGLIVALLLVLLIGTPIAFGLGFTAIVLMLVFSSPSQLMQISNIIYNQCISETQLVIPLFVLMAEIISRGNLTYDLFETLSRWTKRIKGGLAISSIMACSVFAALCGSSPATAAAIGRISIFEMMKRGYKDYFATGVVAAAGTLGIMIPPSISMIIYGILTETSIAKLFIAGILPGIMLAGMLAVFTFIYATFNKRLIEDKAFHLEKLGKDNFWEQLRVDLKLVAPLFVLILIILGGIYKGLTTPTEAAAIGAIGALIIISLMRRINKNIFVDSLLGTVKTSVMILFIIVSGLVLSYIVSYIELPQKICDWIIASGFNKWYVLIATYILWFILGCLIDPTSMIVLTIPFLFPALVSLGFDPIWLGVVSTLSIEIGMVTPPVGLNLFVIRGVSGVSIERIVIGVLPYIVVLIVGLVVLTLFPEIALYLPSKM